MRIRRWFTAFSLAGVCLLMASCIDSKEPISDPLKAKADPALYGVWRKTDTSGNSKYCHIGRAGGKLQNGFLHTINVSHNRDGFASISWDLIMFSSDVGKDRFLNIAVVEKENVDKLFQSGWDSKLVQGYWIAKYEVRDDTLTYWQLDFKAVRKAVETGKIKGTIKKAQDEENRATITDTPENIAALLASPDGAGLLVKEPIRYQRVK